MRTVLIIVILAVITFFSANSAFAAETKNSGGENERQQELGKTGLMFRDKIKDLLDEYKGITHVDKRLKAAGVSYQEILTAGTDNLSKYTKGEQQRIMAGVYTYDAGYAALFFQKKEMARFLDARQVLNEKIGFTAPLPPKMKKLLQNSDSIRDFEAWTGAMDEAVTKFMTDGMTSKNDMTALVDILYGMVIEGVYMVTEFVFLTDYPSEMLALMDRQHEQIIFMMKLLNIFRGDEEFGEMVALSERISFLSTASSYLMVTEFTQQDVDGLRALIGPERKGILEGRGKTGALFSFVSEPPKE